uniref:Uncharacterized protein n=1 Tax=Theileria annulata TaxID=5874 RepID=A0A3B0MPN3_THEAN
MQTLTSSIKNSRIGKVPQIGLRAVNKLHDGHTSDKFWVDYIDYVGNRENFKKLSPHSKCLLTCVITKFDRNLLKKTRSDELLVSIFSDVINARSIALLNLELLNMILVSSYTLGIPLSNQQLDLILDSIHQHISTNNLINHLNSDKTSETTNETSVVRMGIEDIISILHSLASLARRFPSHFGRISDSKAVDSFLCNIESYLKLLNPREFSLVLFSLHNLNLISHNNNLVSVFYKAGIEILSSFDNQSISTVLYISANNRNLSRLFKLFKKRTDSIIRSNYPCDPDHSSTTDDKISHVSHAKFTGRESCNILCSLIKKGTLEHFYKPFLAQSISDMNLQELCNLCSLLIKNKYPNLDLSNSVVLDSLTISNCFHEWEIENNDILDRLIQAITTNGNFVFNQKSVLLLHYLTKLKYSNLNSLFSMFLDNFNPNHINSSQLILFYNSIMNAYSVKLEGLDLHPGPDSETEVILKLINKVETEILGLDFNKLGKIDLFTLGKSRNILISKKLLKHIYATESAIDNLDTIYAITKSTDNHVLSSRINPLISKINPLDFLNSNDIKHGKFTNYLNIVSNLRNTELLKQLVRKTLNTGSYSNNLDTLLAILNCCKKLHYCDSNVEALMSRLVYLFSCKNCLEDYKNFKSKESTRSNFDNSLDDFLSVLYHLDYFSSSRKYDEIITHSLQNVMNTVYNNKLDENVRILNGKNEHEKFESILFNLSALVFNAVVSSSVLVMYIKYYLSQSATISPTVLKSLSIHSGCLDSLTLEELRLINSVEFERRPNYRKDENSIQTSVFSILGKIGIKSLPEEQVFDYYVDLLIV